MSDVNTILEWIRKGLNQEGRSQAGLAEALGVTRAQITRLLQGKRDLKVRELRQVADYLDLPLPASAHADAANDHAAPSGAAMSELHRPDTRARAVTAAIEAIARGEMVIVTDDDDRENEGDLVMAASMASPEKMAFIIRNCCGIVCAPLPLSEARRLNLAPMVASNDAPLGTAFTVSVDTRHGLTTGISAEQRANTVRALANGNMGAVDFVRPGHVFPLIAREGGVLMRSGHTEAAVDLCKLAGLPPVGVICELANDDGTVMAGQQIKDFAARHALASISVADLIAYRQAREKLVERVSTSTVKTLIGDMTMHCYVTPFDSVQHFAFVLGSIGDGENVPVRLHRADILGDALGGADTIPRTLERFKREGQGILVYLRDGAAGVPVKVAGGSEQTDAEAQRNSHWLDVGLGAQILRDLNVRSIRLRTSSPRTYVGLSGFGIEIAAVESVG